MSDLSKRIAGLSPEQRALLTKKLAGAGSASPGPAAEPIAVVGLGCRLPGADSPDAFWDLLRRGEDAIREIPADRWEAGAFYDPDPEVPGKMATRWGGFLDRVADFDAAFFGIAPREAARMDPQQRLLLEVAWEALEDAGEAVDQLAGSATGVFVGIHSHSSEYSGFQTADPSRIDTYTSTGTAHSIMANRLSYLLDLRGPSLAVDTACSSSLVAVHLACQALRSRECERALAGGVNLILSPELTIAFSKLQMMAADGRCKTFDARADGFVRGEGCGLVVLKRLSDARAAGDRVLAVIRGSAVNQDGRTNGLTAPSGLSQEAVVRQALRNGGVDPADVTYVEAHGTGTALGDPIEVEALGAVFTAARPAGRALVLGSVKTNIGHLEAAAGIAGLIKTVLCIDRQRIPPHLHYQSLNPHISLQGTPFVIAPQGTAWPQGGTSRVAGVSSFGFGGTNAHIVLAEPPPVTVGESHPLGDFDKAERPRLHLLPLSARSPAALQALAREVAESLTLSTPPLSALCDTAGRRRSHHGHRVAVVGATAADLRARLQEFLAGEGGAGMAAGSVEESLPSVAFVFSGQGPQWPGMGRDLLEEEPAFREAVAECDALLAPLVGWSVTSALQADDSSSRLGETEVAQPAIFALQVGLDALWRSWGIVPSAVVGHSVGEVAAAYVAGALSLADAARVIAHRGRIMQKATGRGKMAAVELGREQAEEAIRGHEATLAVAAVNGPTSSVLSGESAVLDVVLAGLQGRGVVCRPLRVNYAFHSPQMEPFQAELAAALAGLTPRACTLPMISTVTGRAVSGSELGAGYWGRNIRATVRFRDAIEALIESGHGAFLEIGPHPVLSASVSECLAARGSEGHMVSSLRRGQPARASLLTGLAAFYVQGLPVSWARLEPAGPPIALPRYPWQRQRHWFGPPDRSESSAASLVGTVARPPVVHPLLGRRLAGPLPTFEARVGTTLPLLDQHRLWGRAVLPLNAGLEMAWAAAAEVRGNVGWALQGVEIHEPVVVDEGEERTLQVVLVDSPREDARFQIFALDGAGAPGSTVEWRLHLGGQLGQASDGRGAPIELEAARQRCRRESDGALFYRRLAERGFAFGPMLQGIETLWHGPGEIVATVRGAGADPRWGVNPGLLMSAFLLAWAAADDRPDRAVEEGRAFFPVRVDRFAVFARPASRALAHVRLHPGSDPRGFTLDLHLHDEAGGLLAEATGVAFRLAGPEMFRGRERGDNDWLYDATWVESPRASGSPEGVLASPARIAEAVAQGFAEAESRDAFTRFDALFPGLEELSAAYVAEALRTIGFDLTPGATVSAEDLGTHLGVVSAQRKLLDRLLEMLAEDGLLAHAEKGWRVVRALPPPDLARRLAGLERTFPEFGAELALLGRCGPELAGVLLGTTNPLDLLFPQGSLEGVQRLYQDSPVSRCHNALVRDTVARIVEGSPSSRPIRILEVGAGTGGTTSHVLPVLPADRTEYVFTDVSPMFASRAKETFARYPFVSSRVLDAERDAIEQGFAAGSFDLVLAANVVHATRDLRGTLRNLRQLLKPGGVLVIYEVTARQRWIDLTFGLTDGWWRFTDHDLRPSYPLLTRHRWLDLFAREGWEEGAALPGEPGVETSTLERQSVLIARAPAATSAGVGAHRYVLFADAGGVGRELAAELQRGGHQVVVAEGAGIESLLSDARKNPLPLRGVVDLRALDAAAPTAAGMESSLPALVGGALEIARALSSDPAGTARFFVVTRGVAPPGTDSTALTQASLWGLGRGLSAEVPQVWGGLIDVDPTLSPTEAARRLREELEGGGDEDQVALAAAGRRVPRLAASSPLARTRPVPWRSDRAYLVTGGLGGLGLKVARWMVEQGARHLVLLGRTALPERAQWDRLPEGGEAHRRVSAVRALEALGADVVAVAADVADPSAMAALFARFGVDLPRLAGVVHAAAEVAPCVLADLDLVRLTAMLRPKALGAWILHEQTRGLDLDFFVLFSSTTALWGSAGLTHYAAANAFLDQLALHRSAQGLPVLSVNWGTWDEMRLYSDEQRSAASRSGLREMPSARALQILERLLGSPDVQKVVADVDWRTLKAAYESRRARPFLRGVGEGGAEGVVPAAPPPPSFLARWEECAPDERESLLEDHVSHEAARVLGLDPSQVDRTRGFFEIGMDSLTSAELRRRLEGTLGKQLPSTLAFNYPNVEVLARYLSEQVLAGSPEVPGPEAKPFVPPPVRAPEGSAETEDLSEDDLTDLLAAKIRKLR